MKSILFGEDGIKTLSNLSSNLRENTKRNAEQLDGCKYSRYTPWLSLRPILKGKIDDADLLNPSYVPGDLITNRDYLSKISRLLNEEGHPIMEGMPVKASDWPVMENIANERPDAIAAFHEGRALVRSSAYLETLYPVLVDCVIPQCREKPSGFDSALARGAIFRTFPKGRGGLLAGFQIAHGMGHQAAILIQSIDPLTDEPLSKVIDYSVRNDRRTAYHAIVSAVALAYMVILSRGVYGKNARPFIADDHVRGYNDFLPDAVGKAVKSIKSGTRLTSLGDRLMADLQGVADIS